MATNRWEGDVSTDPTTAGNWSLGAVPAVDDDVVYDGTATAASIGGDLSANQVGNITFREDYPFDTATSALRLQFDCKGAVDIRCGGTHYLDIDSTAETSQINVNSAATVYLVGLNNLSLNVSAAAAIVEVGTVTTAMEASTATVKAGTVTFWQWQNIAAAAPNLFVHGGTVKTYDALGTVRQSGGVWTHVEDVCGSIYLPGGRCKYNSGGTLTGLYLEGGHFDLGEGWRPVTITATQVRAGSTILDPRGRGTWTAGPEFHNCSIADCTVDFGFHKKYTIAAI